MADVFTPEGMGRYAAQALEFLLLGLGVAAAVALLVGVVWFIRFWRTGA